jgi:hypothetical protein
VAERAGAWELLLARLPSRLAPFFAGGHVRYSE